MRASGFLLLGVLDCILAVLDCAKMAEMMSLDDILGTFSELPVKEPDLMRLTLQASVAALVNLQSVEAWMRR